MAYIWNVKTRAETAILNGPRAPLFSVVFSRRDGTRIATAFGDGSARIWDAKTHAEIAVLGGHKQPVRAVAFSADGTRIATASDDRTVRIWDVTGVYARATQTGPPPVALGAGVTRDGTLWIVGRRGYVARRDRDGGWSVIATGTEADLHAVHALDDDRVIVAGAKGAILTRDDGAGEWIPESSGVEATLHDVRLVGTARAWAVGDDGTILYRSGADKTGAAPPWRLLKNVGGHRLTALHVQPNGLAWAGSDGTLGPPTIFQALNAVDAESWRPLPHYTAPWWFLIGLPVLVLAGFVTLRAWRAPPPEPVDSIVGQGTSDGPLGLTDRDALNLRPIALGLSRFLRNVNTEPPLTVAISGRWGTGKSTLMNMLQQDLKRATTPGRCGLTPGITARRSTCSRHCSRTSARSRCRPGGPGPASCSERGCFGCAPGMTQPTSWHWRS